jgi:cellulose binding protein with CBM2 domain
MGRHTKLEDYLADDVVAEDPAAPPPTGEDGRVGWVTKLPLLPVIAGIGAVGVVVAAWSTSQISLNFAGGSPAQPLTEARNGATAQQGIADGRTSRSNRTSTVTIAFRATSRSATGFKAVATITNHGTRPIDGWTLVFRIPNARVLTASNVMLVRGGSVATIRSLDTAPEIAPGRAFRVSFTARGAASTPSACSFNGVVCTLA